LNNSAETIDNKSYNLFQDGNIDLNNSESLNTTFDYKNKMQDQKSKM